MAIFETPQPLDAMNGEEVPGEIDSDGNNVN